MLKTFKKSLRVFSILCFPVLNQISIVFMSRVSDAVNSVIMDNKQGAFC